MKKTWKIDLVNKETNIDFTYHGFIGEEPEHDHEFMEIEYIVSGEVTQYINGTKYECHTGDFLFFYVGDVHKMAAENESKIINLVFHPKLFNNLMPQKYFPLDKRIESFVQVPKAERNNLKTIFYMIKKEYKNKNEGYILVMQSLLQSLICILLRYGYRGKILDDRIKKILEIIDEDCTVSISDIAKICGFCNNHISRIFKENMGETLNNYLIRKKVEYALNLIQTTKLSVESVMEKINLSNKTYFYKVFKKYTGKTPGQIRNI